jgi:hypothetical protein
MRPRIIILFLFLTAGGGLWPVVGQVQSGDQWLRYIEELSEELESEDVEDDERMEAFYADLSELLEHPLDLNTADAERLKQLPFLSDVQIDALIAYRERYGKMVDIHELKHIEALDWPTIELLLPFVCIGETSRKPPPITPENLLKYGRHEVVMRYDRTLQQKQGYRPQPDSILQASPNRKYLGEPFYHSVRYSYTYAERLQAGAVAEKDAGEPFWNRHHKGYDFYSAHLLIRDMGRLKTLVIGDYKASFGQGLVLSHDYMPGRSAILTQAERHNNGFRRHYSTNETDFFRGVASTFRWKDVCANLFYSSRQHDATVEEDRILSFKIDGFHRLSGDREKMQAAKVQVYGGNIRYATPRIVLGVTALTYRYGGNLSVQPDEKPYNQFYFRGSQNANASVDYLLTNTRVKLYGETAVSKNGAWATLNALQWMPASYITGLILHRFYARDFQAYYSHTFAQNSLAQNEQGFYAGLQVTPADRWKLTGYADFFHFPWAKYGVDTPSSGVEYMAQGDYSEGNNLAIYLRYRYRRKETNLTTTADEFSENLVLPYGRHRIRCQMIYMPLPEWLIRPAIDISLYAEDQSRESRGWMLSQNIAWKPGQGPLQADLYLAYFCTDDYNSRISSYEKKLLYMYNTSFFYGQGTRLAAVARYFVMKKLSLSTKVGWSHYLHAKTIGSALETIQGPNRTDLYLMLHWKF